ncbi:MAG: hypothetical protein GXZ11_00595 [Tissierellia bacterium]|nr:hypothetical protein [Tissierellia bacterium]
MPSCSKKYDINKFVYDNDKIVFLLTLVLAIIITTLVPTYSFANTEETVKVQLYKFYDESLSMGNNSIVPEGTLIKEGDKHFLIINMIPLETRDFVGYLGSMKVKGNPVEVLEEYYEVYDDFNDPNKGTDPLLKGKLYPKKLIFPVEFGEEYIDVSVYVPVMAMLGVGEQEARLKVEWPEQTSFTKTEIVKTEHSEPTENSINVAKRADGMVKPETIGEAINIENGMYRIPINLWHNNEDRPSMGDGALSDEAELLIDDNGVTLFLGSDKMTVMDITASLISVYYVGEDENFHRGINYDFSLQIPGEEDPRAKVVSIPIGGKSEFVSIMLDPKVEPMGDDPIKARLKLDWGKIKPITLEESKLINAKTQGAKLPEFNIEQIHTKVDKGITLIAPKGTYDREFWFYSNKIIGEEQRKLVEQYGALSKVTAYRLEALGKLDFIPKDRVQNINGLREKLETKGVVQIKIPLGDMSKDAKLYNVEKNLAVDYSIEDGQMVFSTDSLGVFAIVEKSSTAVATTATTNSPPVKPPLQLGTKPPVLKVTPPQAQTPVQSPTTSLTNGTTNPVATNTLTSSAPTIDDQLKVVNEKRESATVEKESKVFLVLIPIVVGLIAVIMVLLWRNIDKKMEEYRAYDNYA